MPNDDNLALLITEIAKDRKLVSHDIFAIKKNRINYYGD
jgi:hypothetical protein